MNDAPTACMHTVSGSISLPSQGFFSPFPHGTGSLSVSQEYLALEDGPPIFRQNFSCSALLNMSLKQFRIQDYHLLWLAFPRHFATVKLIGSSVFARRYLRNLIWCLFLGVLRCFTSPGLPYTVNCVITNLCWLGFPIQKSPGHRILPPHRRLSQAITSFIASDCQGIHHVHFITWPYNPK